MTLPFIVAAAFFGPFMNWMKSVRRYLGAVEKGIGATLLVFAVLIGTNTVGIIAQWMLDTFPSFGTIG
jgi:cytochrome c-type biogenesis protein